MNKKNSLKFQKLTSAVTLSDMEIFIFPELMIAGALANLMSPIIWQWKYDDFFNNIESLSEYKRIQRVKQYIIDHFVFNLDIETWGLTTKTKEMQRFKDFINFDEIMKYNALMGYEGDKYYYDISIRKFFGLDKYNDDNIPYWKTETVEAMSAFKYKKGYKTGAGECVSFAMLYFAALHIIAKIPLEKIYMMATPLHSQNFVDINGGILTNNRRIVTKNMWFNSTELSFKARRALYNEKVTIVTNINGYVHTIYKDATMPKSNYDEFSTSIKKFLKAEINLLLFLNFLYLNKKWQDKFYLKLKIKGEFYYANLNSVFKNLQVNSSELSVQSIKKFCKANLDLLQSDMPDDKFCISEDMQVLFNKLNKSTPKEWKEILSEYYVNVGCGEKNKFIDEFINFSFLDPRLPSVDKNFIGSLNLKDLQNCESADEVIELLQGLKGKSEIVDLAFMAFREIDKNNWSAFLEAALNRNPVSAQYYKNKNINEIYEDILNYQKFSIYSANRLAQPDEVFNFKTGDGIEKAILFWNILKCKYPESDMKFYVKDNKAVLNFDDCEYTFDTIKKLKI